MTIEHGTWVRTPTGVEGVVIASGHNQVLIQPAGLTAHDAEWANETDVQVIDPPTEEDD